MHPGGYLSPTVMRYNGSMLNVISLTIMITVFGLGLTLGYIIHSTRDYEPRVEQTMGRSSQSAPLTGRLFGFVSSLRSEGGEVSVIFDEALWLTGERARDAAIAAGLCTPEEPEDCLPNDYYIENASGETQDYLLLPDIRIFMETLHHDEGGAYLSGEEVSLGEFRELFENPESARLWRRLPFWITFENGSVVRIEEQYVP